MAAFVTWQTPEEIEQWCTKEDLTEVKRLVHLMKKGYEMQKISVSALPLTLQVINNLFRSMSEPGANEELYSLIVDSLLDWDDKMQIECAQSFLTPLRLDLVNKRNREKTLKVAMQITSDDDYAENEELLDSWITVLETVVRQLEPKFVVEQVTQVVKDMMGLKHPLPKRKTANRILLAVCKNLGETAFDKEPSIIKLAMSLCDDNNYKIRRDGVIFLKEYFREGDKKAIAKSSRFQSMYLMHLTEFINDEDLHIQIDAIEAMVEILDQLDKEKVDNELVPCFLNFIDLSEQEEQQEILERIAELFGRVVFALSKFGLHLNYKVQVAAFYKFIAGHKAEEIRRHAVYNLPAMLVLYKPVETELSLNFSSLFLEFATEAGSDSRTTIAHCLHEAFRLIKDDDDTGDLRKCFLSLVTDADKDIQSIMNRHLALFVEKWGNKHTLENFKGRTAYQDSDGDATPQSRTSSNNGTDFTSAVSSKKRIAYVEDDSTPKLTPIYVLPENERELVFSDLLQRLLVFMNRLRSYPGWWREHLQLIRNLNQVVHLFYMPEIHTHVVPMLMEWVAAGNRELQQEACKCLAKIYQWQHHSTSRTELQGVINQQLFQSSRWS